MRLFIHLMRKEARGVRWHVYGSMGFVVFLAFLAQWVMATHRALAHFDAAWGLSLLWTVAGAFLGGGAVAADLFGGEASSRRVEGTALLPVGLGRVFAAKAVVTLLCTAAITAMSAAVGPFAAWAIASDVAAAKALSALDVAPWIAIAMLSVVAAIALFSIVFEHGLGSVLGGAVAVVAGAIGVARIVPWGEWGLSAPGFPQIALISLPLTALLVGAAALAFVRGPIHLPWRRRRAALGLGSALATLLGGGAIAWGAMESRLDVEPGDSAAFVSNVIASPDGKHALLMVGSRKARNTSHAWIVDVASGRITPVGGRYMTFQDWTAGGDVRLWSGTRIRADMVDSMHSLQTIDVATGRVRSESTYAEFWKKPRADGWACITRDSQGVVVEWPERGIRRSFAKGYLVSVSPRPGRLCVTDSDGLTTHVEDLEAGPIRTLQTRTSWDTMAWRQTDLLWLDGGRLLCYRTPSGKGARAHIVDCETGEDRDVSAYASHVSAIGDGGYIVSTPEAGSSAIVDVRDGRIVAGPWTPARAAWFLRGNDRFAQVERAGGGGTESLLVDLTTGRETPVALIPGRSSMMNVIAPVAGDRFLVLRPGNGLDLIDTDGRVVRTVLGAVR